MQRILLVDDELGIIKMLKTILHKEGYTNIDSASTGKETMTKIMKNTYDLIVLDVMLPDIDGFKLCQKIRQHTFMPILFLTARTGDLDKLTGLGIGGDDYITKPFNPLEVAARINVQFRRMKQYRQNSMKQEIYHFGTVTVNKKEAKLLVDNREISCPAKEFELLLFLVEHPNQVFTAGQLYENVWGYESMGDEQTVKVHINRLRKKVEPDLKNPSYIINIRGIGYKFSFSEGGQI
ncbi:MAG: response regulator transcription factor [Clostridium sp.]|jgi:DNA-binding response OmpR family regulator|uniref:response regulator transcription factor n=1 Tax=Clostridium sp. TaxID=1506 RepID=UPI0025BF84CF|nr:response regulator transcription factor [Clostridium sp.]MCH3965173.1 response regulator transcription factor [Clostridium sp.]MCI1714394.1 response regulator transcription factor [Clostridium sp.]MCI1798656.1 response regulator transcription factor [Clostridium sp.]MCI1812613.1 response regulator transcription factor [Clostridium sp.]MCI1869465.1 response regulator transcription factor [Clostridium sp.]